MKTQINRFLSLVLAFVMVFSMIPSHVVFAVDELDPSAIEGQLGTPTEPVCTGLADCAAQNHQDSCEKKLADEMAAAAARKNTSSSVEQVQAMMNDLPESMTEDTKDELLAYKDTLDAAIGALSAEEIAQLDFTKYNAVYNAPMATATSTWEYTTYYDSDEASGYCAVIDAYNGSGGSVTIPSTLGGYKVKGISTYTFFYSDAAITSLSGGSNLKWISDVCGLEETLCSVNLSSATIEEIPSGAFSNCTKLTSFSWPKGVKKIGSIAFSNTGLTSVTIPSTVTQMGGDTTGFTGGAFQNCTALKTVTINATNLTQISYDTFKNCTALQSIKIPSGVTTIGNNAFIGCTALTTVNWGTSKVTSIGDSAFSDCTALTTLTLPSTLTRLGEMCFADSGITSLTLPDSLSSFSGTSFKYATKLTDLFVNETNTRYKSEDGVLFNKSGTTLICYPAGKAYVSKYQIPDGVTTIGQDAFGARFNNSNIYCGSGNIGSIYFPDTVKQVAEGGASYYGGSFYFCGDRPTTDDYYSLGNPKNVKYYYTPGRTGWTAGTQVMVWPDAAHCTVKGTADVAPTCTVAGGKEISCPICGYSASDLSGTAALGHDWTEWSVLTEASCTAEGQRQRSCQRESCTEVETETIAKLSHSWQDATCTTLKTCSVCGATEGELAEHSYDENEVCTACGYVLTHTFGEWKEEVAATCAATGTKAHKECADCKKAYDENGKLIADLTIAIDSSNHVNTENKAQQDATCTADGYTAGVYCNDCKQWLSGHEVIPASHTFGEWTDEVAATCIATGTKAHKDCTICKKHFDADGTEITDLTIAINADNHANTTKHAQQAPTATEVGYTAGVYCDDCKQWISGHEEIAPGHYHPLCGASCDCDLDEDEEHNDVYWTAWSGGSLSGGYYYLTKNITLSRELTVTGNVKLCLNGYTITFAEDYGISVESGGSLVLCDCVGTSMILRGTRSSSGDSSIIGNSGTLTIYGCSIGKAGEGLSVYNDATLYAYGGNWEVQLSNYGTAKLYDVNIDTTACEYDDCAMYNAADGRLTVEGGQFKSKIGLRNKGWASLSKATINGTNYGIENTNDADVYLYGGTITGTGATAYGIYNVGYVSVSYATVSGNVGIYNYSNVGGNSSSVVSTCKISGGTITGTTCGVENYGRITTSVKNGQTIKYHNKALLEISGSPSISKVLLCQPNEFNCFYTGTAKLPVEIDEANFVLGDVVISDSNRNANVLLLNENYYLQTKSGYSSVYLGSRLFGKDGDNLRWDITDGTLTITGTGEMENFDFSNNQPWADMLGYNNTLVTAVSIAPGVTSVGSSAFAYMNALTEIVFPEGVTSIGSWAMEGCIGLKSVSLPSTLKTIGRNIFLTITPAPTVTYNGCEHMWEKVAKDSMQSTPINPECLPYTVNAVTGCCSVCGEDVHEHSFGEWSDEVAATCIATGTKGHKDCGVCKKHFDADGMEIADLTIAIDSGNHINTETKAQQDASCTADGYTAGEYCNDCKQWLSGHEVIPAGHTFGEWNEEVAATCIATGTKAHKDCGVCKKHFDAEGNEIADLTIAIDSGNHINTEDKAQQDATCTADGYTAGEYCNDCKQWLSGHEVIPAGHTFGEWNEEVAATCIATGTKAHKDCGVCKKHFDADGKEIADLTIAIDSGNHINTETKAQQDATCTADGYTAGEYCNDCKQWLSGHEVIPAGHTFGEWNEEVAATCIATGTKAHKDCGVCKKHFDAEGNEIADLTIAIDSGNHINTEDKAQQDATCTADGYTAGEYCNDCKQWLSGHEVIPAGHTFGEWNEEVAATCIATGTKAHKDCGVCKKHFDAEGNEIADLTIAIDSNNHINTEDKAQQDASCTADGYTAGEYCNDCKQWLSGHEPIPASHTFSMGIDERAATCVATGIKAHKECDVCKKHFDAEGNEIVDLTIAIDSNNHINTETKAQQDASCTADGYTAGEYCNDCKQWLSGHEPIPAGHTFGKWIDEVAATCKTKGTKAHKDCTICKKHFDAKGKEIKSLTIAVDKDNHVGGTTVINVVAATAEKEGYTGDTICKSCKVVLEAGEKIPCTIPAGKNRLILNASEFTSVASVWVDGREYVLKDQVKADGKIYIYLNTSSAKAMTTYTYNKSSSNRHEVYPTGMKVWVLERDGDDYKAVRVSGFDNLLRYQGSSIRMTGVKGIRMITGIAESTRQKLMQGGISGYTLEEYGTVLGFADQMKNGSLALTDSYAKSNYAYKRGVSDAVFANSGGIIQYTNVLVGFTMDQCSADIAMRPYIKLKDAQGNITTVYGGIVYRSIGYIAWQNRNTYSQNSEGGRYIWDIIEAVYKGNYPKS